MISHYEVTGLGEDNSLTGGIDFVTNTPGGLTADLNDVTVNDGSVSIINLADGGGITLGGGVTVNDGNITISITGSGSLADAEGTDNTLAAYFPTGDEARGNIYINLNGPGDVDLYELFADNSARVDVADGNVKIVSINGELVAIQVRADGKDVDVGEFIAGTQIVVSGSNIDLGQISQRQDEDGMLVVTVEGTSPDQPISSLVIGDIRTNADSGIRFDSLWVENADIHMSQGQLWIDQLYVEDVAHFSNDYMVAGVYGSAPIRDGSDSIFWNNTAVNRPEANLDAWLSGTGDWMYLRIVDDHTIESNGVLLMLDTYDYVYRQRITAEDHLRDQLSAYLDGAYEEDVVMLYNRYDLIEDNSRSEGGTAGEVIVEV